MGNTLKYTRAPLGIAVLLGVSLTLSGCAAGLGAPSAGTSTTDHGSSSGTAENAPADNSDSKNLVDAKGVVPDWVAAGFPLYPGSESEGGGELSDKTMISFSVPGSDEGTIYTWFVEQYSQNGWEARDLDDASSDLYADHADGREAHVNVTKSAYVIWASRG